MRKKFLITILMALGGWAATAQEYTHDVTGFLTDTTIVRAIDAEKRLVYSDYPGSSCFILYTDISTTAQKMMLPSNYHVRDFVLTSDNGIYFCGYKSDNGKSQQAFCGHFGLNNFPSATVTCMYFSDLSRLDKIAHYYQYDDGTLHMFPHILMTGRATTHEAAMVEVCQELIGNQYVWEEKVRLVGDQNTVFDDVKLTSNKVIFTMRDTAGRIWMHGRPTGGSAFQSVLGSTYHRCDLSYPVNSALQVEPAVADTFAVVSLSGNYLDLAISWFAGTNFLPNTSRVTLDMVKSRKLNDLCFAKQGKFMEALTWEDYNNVNISRVFHLNQAMRLGAINVDATLFYIHNLQTLDILRSQNSNLLFSSGYMQFMQTLKLYKYNHSQSSNCTTRTTYNTTLNTYWEEFRKYDIPFYMTYFQNWEALDVTTGTVGIQSYCN